MFSFRIWTPPDPRLQQACSSAVGSKQTHGMDRGVFQPIKVLAEKPQHKVPNRKQSKNTCVQEKKDFMMNKKNLKQLIDAVEQSKTFSMHAVWNLCGTAGCIMGHAHSISKKPIGVFLDLPNGQKNRIVAPLSKYANYIAKPGNEGHITKEHAIRMLRNLFGNRRGRLEGNKEPAKVRHEILAFKVGS